jgi:hypothetical protein
MVFEAAWITICDCAHYQTGHGVRRDLCAVLVDAANLLMVRA